ncbi:MAG: hypothetical protein RLY43_1646 [Bacteroidota bacterium]|jgi:hypothetical protein
MKKLKLLSVLLVLTMMTSCMATFNGVFGTTTDLSSANFSYLTMNVEGKSKATYLLGIGGNDRKSLINEAKQDLLQKHNLKSNQALANVTTSFKNSNYLGLMQIVECTLSADIVEFNK